MTPPPKVWDDILRHLHGELPPQVVAAWLEGLRVDVDYRHRIGRYHYVNVDLRAEEIDSQVRQEVDLQLAQDRIDEANFDPERPRGTLVDVFG